MHPDQEHWAASSPMVQQQLSPAAGSILLRSPVSQKGRTSTDSRRCAGVSGERNIEAKKPLRLPPFHRRLHDQHARCSQVRRLAYAPMFVGGRDSRRGLSSFTGSCDVKLRAPMCPGLGRNWRTVGPGAELCRGTVFQPSRLSSRKWLAWKS